MVDHFQRPKHMKTTNTKKTQKNHKKPMGKFNIGISH